MSPLLKNVLIALVVTGLLGVGYMFFSNRGNDDSLTSNGGAVGEGSAYQETQRFLGYIRDLERIDFDKAIFSDARFTSLLDFHQEVDDEPTGRENPFAPVR